MLYFSMFLYANQSHLVTFMSTVGELFVFLIWKNLEEVKYIQDQQVLRAVPYVISMS